MKTIVMMIILFITGALGCAAQTTYERAADGTLVQVATIHTADEAIGNGVATGEQFKATNGDVFPVYKSAKGRLFIVRTSKTGNNYKQYIDEKQPDKADN